jgi:large conductance mechanosensitive channel
MSIVKEFRDFIARGNVVDLAVGVIIGGAFGAIVKSLVDQVVMPPIGLLTSGVDFSKLEWVLRPDDPKTAKNELVAIQYGAFLNTVIQFLIVAMVVFLIVKLVNSLRRSQAKEEAAAAPPAPTATEALLAEIRDLLKSKG